MARVWLAGWCVLAALLTVVPAAVAEDTSALYDRPVLVLDPGMHTAAVRRSDADRAGRWAVTGAYDKTVRIWNLQSDLSAPHSTIRAPAGPGDVGKIYAVAMAPDGILVAAGGWTRWTPSDRQEQIYLFTRGGTPAGRIADLPNVAFHLIFSPDGRWLAAGLGGNNGIRIYDREADWAEAARDTDYRDDVYGLAFASDGRLATTSRDGHVRLYDAAFQRVAVVRTKLGSEPFGIAFHPSGDRLAVGFVDTTGLAILDGATLASLPNRPDVTGIENGDLSKVTWSQDGETLFAAGTHDDGGFTPVFVWGAGGTGPRRVVDRSARNTVMSLVPLPHDRVIAGSSDPALMVISADGAAGARRGSPNFDPRGQESNFAVSRDGLQVDFGFELWGRDNRVRFDLEQLTLTPVPGKGSGTRPPRQRGLPINNWREHYHPTLAGSRLPLDRFEVSHSLAIHPSSNRFILGADWNLRAFDAEGKLLWQRDVPGTAWAVNITGDGRLVVAAYGDGTIRWHRMDDGRELLAFYPMQDRKNWVAWTPRGYYASTAGAYGVLQWHINRGWDEPPKVIPVAALHEYRAPDALKFVLQELDTFRALGLARDVRAQREFRRLAETDVAPGAHLHVVAAGVSDYGAAATRLRLQFAAKDAHDFSSAVLNTQSGLYGDVSLQMLQDKDADRDGILRALDAAIENMARGAGNDMAVFYFSGHGALIDGRDFYLLPHGVDVRTTQMTGRTAVPIEELRRRFEKMAQYGRVLVLLDACHSGAATADGVSVAVNGGALNDALAGISNVNVLTSSDSAALSMEREEWQNGAFTEVLLGAFSGADRNGNDLITIRELQDYVARELPRLTSAVDPARTQRPKFRTVFYGDLFVGDH